MIHVSAIGADPASPSLYARTKAEGEARVFAACPDAVVFRPSLIFGPGDSFFNRFASLARALPVLPLAGGQSRFQPAFVGDVAEAIARAVDGTLPGGKVYELGGPEVGTLEHLVRYMLKTIRRKRAVVDLPLPAAKLQARLLEIADTLTFGLLPDTLKLTRDQVILLQNDNVVSEAAKAEGRTFEGIGITPTAAEAVVPGYLWTFRKAGQFATDRDEEYLSEVPDMLASHAPGGRLPAQAEDRLRPGDRRRCGQFARERAGQHGRPLGHPEAGLGDSSCSRPRGDSALEARIGRPVVRRILVTGAAGFVGGHVLPLLAQAGDRVAGIGRGTLPDLPAGVTYETLDLLDEAALSAFVARFRPTAILHLAGLASVADSASGPGQTWRVNVNGLMNLVAAVEAVPGCTFFFVSSGEVYGSAFLAGHAPHGGGRAPAAQHLRPVEMGRRAAAARPAAPDRREARRPAAVQPYRPGPGRALRRGLLRRADRPDRGRAGAAVPRGRQPLLRTAISSTSQTWRRPMPT